MSTTITLRKLLNSGYDIKMNEYDVYAPKGYTKEQVRERIKKKFIYRYNDYEIGNEVPELFVEKLNAHLDYIMPYYNQLYKSEDIEFNPLYNVDMTETFTHEVIDEGGNKGVNVMDTNNSRTNKTDGFMLENNTPKSKSSMEDLKNNNYLSSATRNIDETEDNSLIKQNSKTEIVANNTRTEKYTRKNEGSSAGLPFSKAVQQWREVMLNIDKQLIEELAVNFYLIF